MPPLNGVVLPGTLVPTDTTDVYALTDPQYGIDGIRSVLDKATRNAITQERRRQGMLVVVQQDFGSGPNTVWQLKPPPWNNSDTDWANLFSRIVTSPVGGDLSGTLPNPLVVSTNGIPFGTMATQDAGAVDITGGIITGLPIPVFPSDAVNKSYVDTAITGLTVTFIGDVYGTGSGIIATTVLSINGTPLGSTTAVAGNLLIASGTEWISVRPKGDATISSAGVIVVTRTNGVPFAPSAILDTTNADNLLSGTVSPARLGTGIADNTTFLRGDNTWAVTGGSGEEVYIGPDDPIVTDPTSEFELWYDTDDNDPLVPNSQPTDILFLGSSLQAAVDNSFQYDPVGATLYAPYVSSDGSKLYSLNASSFSTGTVPIAQLGNGGTPSSSTFLCGDNTWKPVSAGGLPPGSDQQVLFNRGGTLGSAIGFSYNYTVNILTVSKVSGDGSLLLKLNANNLASGIVSPPRLGTGTADSTTFLRGDNTWQSVATGGKTTWVIADGTPITVGADQTAWAIMDQARTMSKVYVCAKTAPTGNYIILDILYSTDNGTTFTSLWAVNPGYRPAIAAGSKFGTTTTFDTTAIPAGAILRVDVVQVGSIVAGQDVTVQLQYQ